MRDTTARGDLSELEIVVALTRAGKRLLKPLSSAARYDIAIDNGDGTFVRIQCKTGVFKHGRIIFRVCSTDARRPAGVSYQGQVDAFGVYCPQTGGVYLVPMLAVAACGTMSALRLSAPRNNQSTGIRYARDYEVKARGDRP